MGYYGAILDNVLADSNMPPWVAVTKQIGSKEEVEKKRLIETKYLVISETSN